MTGIINGARTTLAEFLGNGVTAGEHIRRDSRDATYVFTGIRDEDEGIVWLLTPMGTLVDIADGEADAWSIVRDDSNMPVTESPLVLATARHLILTRADVRAQRDHADRLNRTIRSMRSDWELLNEHLSTESTDRDWCGVYDQLIEQWNSEFQTMQLEPRSRDYEVEVEITATWTVRVPVSGMTSEEAAQEYVSENYDAYEAMSASSDSWDTPDNADVEIGEAYIA
jgi:hypothetical protein